MPQMSKPPRPFNQNMRWVFLWAFQFILLAGPLPASDLLPPGFRPLPLGVHALVGGRVVIKPGEVLDELPGHAARAGAASPASRIRPERQRPAEHAWVV
jgi:hypothetical protein